MPYSVACTAVLPGHGCGHKTNQCRLHNCHRHHRHRHGHHHHQLHHHQNSHWVSSHWVSSHWVSRSTDSNAMASGAASSSLDVCQPGTTSESPPKARKPASIADTRFEKQRELRQIRCDHCEQLKGGNAAGAFCHRKNMPPAGERQAAWERGDWDATWYCTECYMLYYDRSYEDVCNILGFARRNAKKARYAEGKP